MKNIILYTKTFIVLITLFFAFAVVSCLLPDQSIKRHIAESAPMIAAQGMYPKVIIDVEQCQTDNFTDALIMNQIHSIDRKHPVKSAMQMIRMSEKGRDWDQLGLLTRTVNGEPLYAQHYARYWHGGSFFYRFLFLFANYNMIKLLLFIVSSLLLCALCFHFHLKAGPVKTSALVLGFAFVYGFVTQFSMQFFPVLALTIISSLMVIKREKSANFGLLFFVVGSLTCYFDLLTTPLLTLGLPLAIMLSLKNDNEFKFKDNLIETSKIILLWGLGFALTFVTKWALASLILGQNIFADAYEVSLYRMEAEEFTRWDALTKNFEMLNLWIIGLAAVALLLFSLINKLKINYKKVILFLFIALMPYVWYLLVANHSHVHWWFTYRLQAISVVCLLLMLCDGSAATRNGKSSLFTP